MPLTPRAVTLLEGGTPIFASGGGGRWSRGGTGKRGARRGISDVVGTILLLGLTVTLFSSIFFFVNSFPRPPAQPSNQFQSSLGYTGSAITSVSISHLAGPTLAGNNVLVYLYSASKPTKFTAPYHLFDGLNGSTTWSLGQTWFLNITNKTLSAPDNITVSITAPGELLFRVTLPGSNPDLPPTFVNSGTAPVSPGIGQGFTIFVQITDPDLKTNSVFVNISQLPGAPSTTALMTFSAVTNLWTYAVANGVTTNTGTFYVFVNATDRLNQRNSIAIPVIISTSGVTQANVQVTASPALPVVGSAVTLTAVVTNPGSNGGKVNVTFTASGSNVGTASGGIAGGSTASFSTTWTPATTGVVTVGAIANLTGGGSVSGTLNLTVYPKILLIAHNVVAGAQTTFNESAYLAQSLQSAGIPFTSMFVACSAALPTSATMGGYGVVVIDFGSSPSAACNASRSATEVAKITGTATSTNFWIVGSTIFGATTCVSYANAFYTMLGIKYLSGGTCDTLQSAATTAATWAGTPASGLRADGIGALTINKTLSGSSAFQPYVTFTQGTTNTAFLTTAAGSVGAFFTSGSGQRGVGLGTDPALLATALPNGNSWVDNSAGTAVTYNVMNYLCKFATSASPGRGLIDHAVAGVLVWGQSHTKLTTVYAELRANGPASETLTVTLYINGSVAIFGGVLVSATLVVGANGGVATAALSWEAPGAGKYTLSVVIATSDLNFQNNQLPASILNQPVTFG